MSPASSPRIPDLELIKTIGSGSYGEVWLARTMTGIYRAVKIVDRFRFRDERPWLREFAGISRFQKSMEGHQRQMALLHVGQAEDQGFFYYVMELADDVVRGTDIIPESYEAATLKAVRERRPPMSLDQILRLGEDLARALGDLHAADLIHRDVKPSNIVFVQGVPKLADLGLVASSEFTLTSLGTPGYTPPEGVGSKQGDIFSLGKILYELAMGRPSTEFPALPPELLGTPDAPRLMELNEVLLKACHPNPDQRYQDTSKLLADLLLIQAGGSVVDLTRLRERLRYARHLAAALGALALIVGVGLGIKNYQSARRLASSEASARIIAEKEARLARYTADLQLAQMGADAKDFGAVRKVLRRHIPGPEQEDLRGLEWYALWNSIPVNHSAQWIPSSPHRIDLLPASPAKDSLLWTCNNSDSAMGILNLHTGEVRTLATKTVDASCPSPEGRITIRTKTTEVPSSSPSKGFFDVDIKSGAQTPRPEYNGRMQCSSPQLIITGKMGSDSFSLDIWDRKTHAILRTWISPKVNPAPGLADTALSPDSSLMAIGYFLGMGERDRYISVLDVRTGADIFCANVQGTLQKIAISPDNKRLAAGGTGWLAVWDITSGQLLWRSTDHQGNTIALDWHPDSHLLAAGGSAQNPSVWDSNTGNRLCVLYGSESNLGTLLWNNDGTQLLASNGTGTVLSFPYPPKASVENRLPGISKNPFFTCAFSDNDNELVLPNESGALSLYSLNNARWSVKYSWPGASRPLYLDPSSRTWLALSDSSELMLCSPGEGNLQATPLGLKVSSDQRINCLGHSKDGSLVAFGYDEGSVEVWNLQTRKKVFDRKPFTSGIIRDLTFSNDLACLFITDHHRNLVTVDLATGLGTKQKLELPTSASIASINPDGSLLAMGLDDGTIAIIDARSLAIKTTFPAHRGKIYGLCFSPDGRQLISASMDGVLAYWSCDSWRLISASIPFNSVKGLTQQGILALQLNRSSNKLFILGINGENKVLDLSKPPLRSK